MFVSLYIVQYVLRKFFFLWVNSETWYCHTGFSKLYSFESSPCWSLTSHCLVFVTRDVSTTKIRNNRLWTLKVVTSPQWKLRFRFNCEHFSYANDLLFFLWKIDCYIMPNSQSGWIIILVTCRNPNRSHERSTVEH